MRSNSLSSYLGFTTFGESHGPALGLVIEDIKPNIEFPFEKLRELLSKRKTNSTKYSSKRSESDNFQVISGLLDGKTTGMPICLLFWNNDAISSDYENLKDVFRPGHADFSWFHKFKIYDYRGGGRASGRETISRIAASAIVDKVIKPINISFQTIQIGKLKAKTRTQFFAINLENPFCWADFNNINKLYDYLDSIKLEKDTVGGLIQVKIDNVPLGLGDPVFEKLNANLAKAIFSIGSVKGVTFGDGDKIISMKGSDTNDQMSNNGFVSNHSGGIVGGISNGQPIKINIIVKPVSSHGNFQKTINYNGEEIALQIKGRHDICHIPRILPVIEAMIKLTLSDAISWQKHITEATLDLIDYRDTIDKIDEDLLLQLYKRKMVVKNVFAYKRKNKTQLSDSTREKAIKKRWIEIAQEFDLPEKEIHLLLKIVLTICRNDNSISSL